MFRRSLAAAALAALAAAPAALAQANLTNQHVDLTLGFTPPAGTPSASNLGAWQLNWSDETNGVEYATSGPPGSTSWAQVQVGTNTLTPRNASSSFNFIGVPAGTPYYYLPSTQVPNRVYLGVGAEDNDAGAANAPIAYRNTDVRINQPTAFDPDANLAPWLKLRLVSMTGPAGGRFSLWSGSNTVVNQTDQGVNQVWMATSDGIDANDALYIINGSHIHFSYAFTLPGTYDLTFEASAYLGGTETDPSLQSTSELTTFRFVVLPAAVPEPVSVLAAGAAGLGAVRLVWRRGRTRAAAGN